MSIHKTKKKTMKAIVYQKYGSPDVLQLQDVEKPTPSDNEVLIKVHAASVNPLDWHYLRGTPFPMRIISGLLKPKRKILGADMAGRIDAAGRNVKQFQPGDEVYGDMFPSGLGAFAEYVCVSENSAIVQKPANTTFEKAAAVPVAAFTALQGLRDHGQIQSGQKVLINGASGGVGTFAVQIAKSFGAEVTGVCSTRNLDMVHSIGADQAIDYTQEDFTQNGQRYDLIIDNVANRLVSDYMRALSLKGRCVVIGYSPSLMFQVMLRGPWLSMFGSKKIGLMGEAKANKKDLAYLKELLEADKIVPVIDRCYPLSEVPEAIRYLEKGHAQGKVVITVEPNNKT
jgi:NADPH:quinone reductase-like Zn-dependent oxidoreductase